MRVYMLMPTCVCAGVRAYPPVCVCAFPVSARELTCTENTPSVAEETDIDAEEVSQVVATEESNLNRGVTDLDATAKTTELNQSESKVSHPAFAYVCIFLYLWAADTYVRSLGDLRVSKLLCVGLRFDQFLLIGNTEMSQVIKLILIIDTDSLSKHKMQFMNNVVIY